ncbi:MAG TPA: hypothetical protein VMV86_06725 [Methanosarcinales archaeon]|nr:hypothetical protein [Methanosarcinales archaeon]
MKIIFDECIDLTEERVIALGKKNNLTDTQIENMWSMIREIPVKIVYDTDTCTVIGEIK